MPSLPAMGIARPLLPSVLFSAYALLELPHPCTTLLMTGQMSQKPPCRAMALMGLDLPVMGYTVALPYCTMTLVTTSREAALSIYGS